MKKCDDELTFAAVTGWQHPNYTCPYLATSRMSDAWHLGQHFRRAGLAAPSSVAASRGNGLRVNRTAIYAATYSNDGQTVFQAPIVA